MNSHKQAKRSKVLLRNSRAGVHRQSRSDHAGYATSLAETRSQQMLPNVSGNTGGSVCFIELYSVGQQDALQYHENSIKMLQ